MERITNEVCDKKLKEATPTIYQQAYNAAYQDFCANLTFDVTSCVEVAFSTGETIFKDRKTQQIVATRLTNEILKQMKLKPITLKL